MNRKTLYAIGGFKYPASMKNRSRVRAIMRFITTFLPECSPCTIETERLWKHFFDGHDCAYCGHPATHLDHLHPIVKDSLPTGFGTDPSNLVPCCRLCHARKRDIDWRDYISSDKCYHFGTETDIQRRIEKLEAFESAMRTEEKKIHYDMCILNRIVSLAESFDAELKSIEDEIRKTI